jgi:L-threonylcarbamoyladenylate synthase
VRTEDLLTTDPLLAARALRNGHLAVLPTETVYGLGARALDPRAVARVYAVKGRPADHPLIVHLPAQSTMDGWARDVPAYARRLAEAFWPGPLTLVMQRGERAGRHLTGGADTVGLRVPDHPLTLAVLDELADGVAAPSANLFGRVSPTTAQHVLAELGGRLLAGNDAVLDGGACRVGVESTIVDATGAAPRMLRPGVIGATEVVEAGGVALDTTPSPVRAPGTLASHYSPNATVHLTDPDELEALVTAASLPLGAGPAGRPNVGLLALATVATPPGVVRLSAPQRVTDFAAVLYASLREADALQLRRVLVVAPSASDGGEESGLADAIRDRLQRAAHR